MTNWKLMPEEPTNKMLDDAERIDWVEDYDDVRGNCRNIWHGMVAVAPEAPRLSREELLAVAYQYVGYTKDGESMWWGGEDEIVELCRAIEKKVRGE